MGETSAAKQNSGKRVNFSAKIVDRVSNRAPA